MNDPGLDEPIQDSAKVEDERKAEEQLEEEDEQTFLVPSRWWAASTAFPLIAGTFGPIASAFNICALIQHWRVEIPPGMGANESHGNDVRDPTWLLANNGVSLVLALFANFSLLLNMTRRLSFSIAQPITITGWYLSSIFLIGDLVGIIHVVKIPGQRRALTQAFYYAIFAAGLYFVIASLMVFTVYGAWKGHYPKEFKLSMSQRTLMLQTISFLIYMIGGAGVYAKIEGWMFLDAVYFTNYTLLTIGIGDYAPMTHLGRGLLFPYAIGGVVILGLVVGSIRSLVLERGKKKLGGRIVEKRREAMLQNLLKKDQKKKLKPIENKQMAEEIGMSERERREQEFHFMRKIQKQAATRQKWTALIISATAWLVLWFLGALIFYFAEHEQEWTYFVSLYFAYTSLITIGYGDFAPYSNSGKAFFVFWALLAIPTLTILISNMGDTVVKGIRDLTLHLGEITILPGEAGVRGRMKQVASRSTRGKIFEGSESTDLMDEPPGIEGAGQSVDAEKGGSTLRKAGATDHFTGELEAEELREAKESKSHGDYLSENIHEYHYLLIKEFRNVMKHLDESPPRKYNYGEWAWFLKLIGEDESQAATHRAAPVKVKKNKEHDPDIGEGPASEDRKGKQGWSWLGNRSPLMGETEEAEWVLERLSRTLERLLKDMHMKNKEDRGAEAATRIRSKNSGSGSSGTMGESNAAANKQNDKR